MNTKLAIAVVALIGLIGAALVLSSLSATNTQVTQTQQSNQPVVGKPAQPIKDATIKVTKAGFSPQTLTIKVGTRVIWVNQDAGTVSVNSAVHPTHLVYPPLNLGAFNSGSSVQLVFSKPGSYSYHNHYNPSQTGTIVVTQ